MWVYIYRLAIVAGWARLDAGGAARVGAAVAVPARQEHRVRHPLHAEGALELSGYPLQRLAERLHLQSGCLISSHLFWPEHFQSSELNETY